MKTTIFLFELFKDKAALDAHKKQPHTILFSNSLKDKCAVNKVTFLKDLKNLHKDGQLN